MKSDAGTSWTNDIRLTYQLRLMKGSSKTPTEAADDMITGVTIGTGQTSEGIYTPKMACVFGPDAGAYRGEIVSTEELENGDSQVIAAFPREIAQVSEAGFAGLFSVASGDGLGTAYEMSKIRLVGLELPLDIAALFPGPAFGSAGIRKWLGRDDPAEPLVALLLKPNTGQPSTHYARFAREAALAGVDYIKEDELQLNHPACPLLDRTEKILAELRAVADQTGRKVMYAPNITARSQAQMIEKAKSVVELGAPAVMINVMQVGLDSLRVLREANLGVPIHIHRTGHDNYSRGDVGVDLNVLSQAFRLGGADLIHTGPVFGNLFDPEAIIDNVDVITSDRLPNMKPSLPILSRSATSVLQDSIDYLATDPRLEYPANVMFLVDKEVYQRADPTSGSIEAAARTFVEKVKSTRVQTGRSKKTILESQGYTTGTFAL